MGKVRSFAKGVWTVLGWLWKITKILGIVSLVLVLLLVGILVLVVAWEAIVIIGMIVFFCYIWIFMPRSGSSGGSGEGEEHRYI